MVSVTSIKISHSDLHRLGNYELLQSLHLEYCGAFSEVGIMPKLISLHIHSFTQRIDNDNAFLRIFPRYFSSSFLKNTKKNKNKNKRRIRVGISKGPPRNCHSMCLLHLNFPTSIDIEK
jgi:hypothetical protein